MTREEYREFLNYELYRDQKCGLLQRLRIRYLQPNTNCMYLCRKMWYLYSRGGMRRVRAKMIYLRILHRYGCMIFPYAKVGKGFRIAHPVGIVLGKCEAGENLSIYQNCTIGIKHPGDEALDLCPRIGNDVHIYAGSAVLGDIEICDRVSIAANSVVLHSIAEPGIYGGTPAKRIK